MKGLSYRGIKRFLDVFLSLAGLVTLSPVLLLIALAVKLESRGPAVFKQRRVGEDKRYFDILKFRTMRMDAPSSTPTHMLSDPDQYLTRTGKFLRKTSLDELLQMINILKGDMSIVGPRPALWNQYDLIRERDEYDANSLKPGLTGWAQIHGRDELKIPEKAALDGFYAKHISFRMDAVCFFRTIGTVLKSDGIVEGKAGEIKNGDHV